MKALPRVSPSAEGPSIVYVFPVPVYPYAKMQTFMPSSAVWTNGLISLKTSAYEFSGKYTWSKLYIHFLLFNLDCVNSSVWWEIFLLSACPMIFYGNEIIEVGSALESSKSRGLTLQKTLIFPLRLSICCCYIFLICSFISMLFFIAPIELR